MSNGIVRKETYGLVEKKHWSGIESPFVVGEGGEFYLAENARGYNSSMVLGLSAPAKLYKEEDKILLGIAKKLPDIEQICQNTEDLKDWGLGEDEINELKEAQGLRVREFRKDEDGNIEIVVGGKNLLLDKPGDMILTVGEQDFKNHNLDGAKIKEIRIGIVKYLEEDRLGVDKSGETAKKRSLHDIVESLKERYFGRGRDRE